MYKLISYYRSTSSYPANARIVQVTPSEYVLFIQHDTVGTIHHRKGRLNDLKKDLFSFIPYGLTRPILWKKVLENGD